MSSVSRERRGIVLAASSLISSMLVAPFGGSAIAAEARGKKAEDVGAVEDLMREHGVLRRALLVYTGAAARLRAGGQKLDAAALGRTARLFRAFGEDYHEKQLEEAYIVPAIRKLPQVARYADLIVAQHQRGRAINDYIVGATRTGTIAAGDAEPLARAMDGFVLMYAHHAAREDTVVFPAWKKSLSADRMHELSERFEAIEHKQFGKDGFDDAVRQIGEIERSLGLDDLAQFTAPPPPTLSQR